MKYIWISLKMTLLYIVLAYILLFSSVANIILSFSDVIFSFLSLLFLPAFLIFGIGIRGSSIVSSVIVFLIIWAINYGLYISFKNPEKAKKDSVNK